MLNGGAVRIKAGEGLEIMSRPTDAQLDTLYDVIERLKETAESFGDDAISVDVDDPTGGTLFTASYGTKVSPVRILHDVRDWFDRGIVPENAVGSLAEKESRSYSVADADDAGIIIDGVVKKESELEMGGPEWMALKHLKYRRHDKNVAMYELKEEIEDAEYYGMKERAAKLREVKRILESGARLTRNTKTVVIADDNGGKLGKRVTQAEWNAAKKHFGTTDNPSVMGYILPDGTALDLSGGTGGQRSLDHRNISAAIKREKRPNADHPAMVDAVLSGAIRYIPEGNGLQFGKTPTEAQ